MKIGIQGVKGAFHHIAAEERFGKGVEVVECLTFEKVCQAVVAGQVDEAILAIENTTVGSFLPNYSLIREYDLRIVGEVYLQIRHNLLALPNQKIEDVEVVRSQEIALSQCRMFLKQHPHLRTEEVADTALAAKQIAERKEMGVAAIASYRAAEIYGLSIIQEKIESNEFNYTRFLSLSKTPNRKSADLNKATLSFRVKHAPGSLVAALNIFKIHNVNMTKIQSVPIPGLPYEYMMYTDITWNSFEKFEKAAEQLKRETLDFTDYGVYKEGEKSLTATAKATEVFVKEKVNPHPEVKRGGIDSRDWHSWMPFMSGMPEGYFLISGPCSAETEEQTRDTFDQLALLNKVSLFRAGVWKPRTRAGGFEGNGVKALRWLQRFQEETGNKVTVEVASAQHVKECFDHGIFMLWIGARTSANPFSVQEIADAVKGTDVVVMVKNPVNPDLELWLGAIERIANAGVTKLAAIHRGFSVPEKSKYRNYPAWGMPLQLKERLPKIPIINDPSHICGRRDTIAEICQKAIDLGADGFIIESHIDPENAWTDASQQLKPQDLETMLTSLRWKRAEQLEEPNTINALRATLDRLDTEILSILASRMKTAKEIGKFKNANSVPIEQQERWEAVLNDRVATGKKLDLDEKFIRELLSQIHKQSVEIQERS